MKYHNGFLIILIMVTVIGCSSNQQNQATSPTSGMVQHTLTADYYLQRAENSTTPEKEFNQLQAVKILIQTRQYDRAKIILSGIAADPTYPDIQNSKDLMFARLALIEGRPEHALTIVNRMTNLNQSVDAVLAERLEIRAEAQNQLGYALASVRDRIALTPLLGTDEITNNKNQRAIWQTLMQLSSEQLTPVSTTRDTYSGWLSLAYLTKTYANQPQQMQTAMNQWSLNYPDHPAHQFLSNSMPSNDFNTRNVPITTAHHVGLLLPIEGPLSTSAQAIRDGFFTAYYADQTREVEISVFDTQNDEAVRASYNQARAQGVDLIIGPLTKDGTEQLQHIRARDNSKMPIIALNYTDNNNRIPPPYFYQFGLAPEDEARSAAAQAWYDGHRSAAIIALDSEWGERVAKAFRSQWEALGGQIVAETTYDNSGNDMQAQVKDLLNLQYSEQRASDLMRTINESVDYEPRRRYDIDAVFLASIPVQARQIRPLLTFYYAEEIPIYATSSIYTGTPNPSQDQDMQSTVFCDAPWIINRQHAQPDLQQTIAQLWPDTAEQYGRLYALGIDAYQLIAQLNRLQAYPELAIHGVTGELTTNAQQHIIRRLGCAQFVEGVPQPLPSMTL